MPNPQGSHAKRPNEVRHTPKHKKTKKPQNREPSQRVTLATKIVFADEFSATSKLHHGVNHTLKSFTDIHTLQEIRPIETMRGEVGLILSFGSLKVLEPSEESILHVVLMS